MKLTLTFLALFGTFLAFGHGDLDIRIRKLSKQIEKNPDAAELYLKRGDLYYQHEEYVKSIVDFDQAKLLGNRSDELSILYTRSYIKTKEYDRALYCVNKLLAKDEYHEQANRWKGKLLVDQGNYQNAAAAFETALEGSVKKTPDQFLEIALVYKKMNSEASTIRACKTIEEGIKSLGVLPVFISKIVAYYSSISYYHEAIQYQTKLIELSRRKDLPYYDRARLHIRQNNFESATADLNESINEINKLPPKIRNASATKNLLYKIASLQSSIH